MKIAVVGRGLTASYCIALLLNHSNFQVFHYFDPLKEPSSSVAAGIVHPFNFKTAAWKKYGKLSFHQFIHFLEETHTSSLFHQTGLFFETDEAILLNDYDALSADAPEWIQVQAKGIFFPLSAWLDVPNFLTQLQQQFKGSPSYNPIPYRFENTLFNETYVIHAGGMDSKLQYKHLPLFAKKGHIFLIHVPELDLKHIYWKQFFVVPIGGNNYKIGPDGEESLQHFKNHFRLPYHILEEQKGIKPYATTGRAFCFREKQILFLNGVGGRGILEGLRIALEALHFLYNAIKTLA